MSAVPNSKVLHLANSLDELTHLEAFLEELGEEWELPLPLVMSLNLALEEALANIITYGYDDTNPHEIAIEFLSDGKVLTISIIDDGHEYDPTVREDPDITLSVDDRPIGGLGIFLIKKIMDRVEYQRKNNKNHLVLTKNIES
jgi:serine/threonine-protein kinase RsbW